MALILEQAGILVQIKHKPLQKYSYQVQITLMPTASLDEMNGVERCRKMAIIVSKHKNNSHLSSGNKCFILSMYGSVFVACIWRLDMSRGCTHVMHLKLIDSSGSSELSLPCFQWPAYPHLNTPALHQLRMSVTQHCAFLAVCLGVGSCSEQR